MNDALKLHKELLTINAEIKNVHDAVLALKAENKALKEALAQQSNEQVEPAFWYRNEDIFGNQEMEPIFYATKAWDNCLPLYTHPSAPTAQRKPLTDEQIRVLYKVSTGFDFHGGSALTAFIRAIEAAHGIKENA